MPISTHLPRQTATVLAVMGFLAISGCGGSGGGSGSGSSGSSGGSGGGSSPGTASLSWTAPTSNSDGTPLTDLAGYHIYYGSSADLLTAQIDVNSPTTTSYVINNLAAGTWYFAVSAFNRNNVESPLSATASKAVN